MRGKPSVTFKSYKTVECVISSLVVDQLPHTYDYADGAYMLDIDYIGNGSASDVFAFGMSEVGFEGEYL
jgi:hypothetical protein